VPKCAPQKATPATKEDPHVVTQNKIKLIKTLAKDYEKLIEPGNTTLKIGVAYVCAHYDLSDKRLHSRVFERFSWKDWRLTWDPKAYGGLNVIKVPSHLLWTPADVRLFNAFEDSTVRDDVNAVILSDGTVYWVVPAFYTTLCGPGEVKNDNKGHCHISLGSWTYDADDLPLALFNDGVDQKFYLDDCPHVMSNVNVYIKKTKYDCCPDPYASLEVDFDLEPRTDFHQHGGKDKKQAKKSKGKVGVDCEWPHC